MTLSVIPEPCETPAGTRDGRMAACGGIRGPRDSGRLRRLQRMDHPCPTQVAVNYVHGRFRTPSRLPNDGCRMPWNHSEGNVREETHGGRDGKIVGQSDATIPGKVTMAKIQVMAIGFPWSVYGVVG